VYFEGGSWNQVNRDRADMSGNYAGPGGRINAEHITRGLAAYLNEEELSDEDRQRIRAELNQSFADLRDGLDERRL